MNEFLLSYAYNVDPLFCLYSNCFWSFRQPRSRGQLQSADTHTRWLVTFTQPRTVSSLWPPCDVGHYCAVILIKGAFDWLCWLVTGLLPCERTYVQKRTASGKWQLGWQAPFDCSSAHTKAPPKPGHMFVSGWFVAIIHNVCVVVVLRTEGVVQTVKTSELNMQFCQV